MGNYESWEKSENSGEAKTPSFFLGISGFFSTGAVMKVRVFEAIRHFHDTPYKCLNYRLEFDS